jgi:serine/threonine-protein kinase
MRAADLEKKLSINVEDNFLRDKLARAGFATSGVSGQNRLVERHESPYGAYWKSYDFKSNDGAGNLFRFPLGPVFRRNPYPQQAFQHDGGEMIFHLPNGLQGYLLTNAKDERIDEGPIEVVSDALRTSGTAKILNGLSCMACHNHGMKKEFRDTVRDGTGVLGEAREKVKRLYPRQADMDKLLNEDEERFMQALDRATARFLKVGPNKDKDLRDFAEPIGVIARQYILRELGLDEAAYELGLPDAKGLQLALTANERMRELGLLPLAKGGTIKREVWESLERFISPFQEAASALELGTPKRVR